MTRKRANGEGTIRKRPNGLWEARLSTPGHYRAKSFYGKTQAEARRKRESVVLPANGAFLKWAMLGSNQRPLPSESGRAYPSRPAVQPVEPQRPV
jgi:hypothetical protein